MDEFAVPTKTNPSSTSRPTSSCVRCSDRKVRCDRQNPCSACVRHNVQCLFRAPSKPKRRLNRVQQGNLKEKLERYEALFQKLGINPNEPPRASEAEQHRAISRPEVLLTEDTVQVLPPLSNEIEVERVTATSNSSQGEARSKPVDNNLWSRVIKEFHVSEEPDETSSGGASETDDSDDEHNFVLDIDKNPEAKYSHPPIEQIQQLWEIFVENIDPLTKVVHVPSLEPAFQKAITNISKIPRNFEALIFAIYAAAVMSLTDDECSHKFDKPRESLLSRYTSATRCALSRAKFMGTVSIVVLQAFVLYIFTVRNTYGPRTVWTLTGVAIRIAEGIGLHRDAASLGIPPFEAEIRARIWWQLKGHDFRATELIGLAKFRGFGSDENSCKPPANVNDREIYPGMLSPVKSSSKLTDVAFLIFKTELASFAKRNGAKFRQQEKDINSLRDHRMKENIAEEIEEILQEKYIRHCDASQPLQLMTMLVAQSSSNIVRFLTCHPRRWASLDQTPISEQEYVWKVSLELLEQQDIMQSDPRLQGFAWHSAYYLQWHVIIHVLDTLRAKPLMPDIYKAWRLVEATYKNNPDMISNTTKPIHVAVGSLCLNAFNAYEAALGHKRMISSHEPNYITNLRRQRDAAKARRIAMDTRRKRVVPSYVSSQATETSTKPELGTFVPEDIINTECCQLNATSESASLNQTSESEPFWLTSGFDDSLYGISGDIMNMDTDFMLSQDYFDDAIDQGIDWAQWDAWLGEQNVVHAHDAMGSTKSI